jgi:predicted RNase H-like HicB family nuclease
MKTYLFRIELEPDEEGWRAFCPPLEGTGASTWGKTPTEALKNIQEVLSMIVEESIEGAQPIPATEHLTVAEGVLVAVNL